MTYAIIGLIIFGIVVIATTFMIKQMNVEALIGCGLGLVVFICGVVYVDYRNQVDDIEIWSGKIIDVKHKEEWDEFVPPRTETYTTTDSKGKAVTKTRIIDGYWKHHRAENYIETTDRGRFSVSKVPSGERLTDKFVNSTEELEQHYPLGSATASTHTYENKLKASYSIFKHRDVDLTKYEDLPNYPTEVNSKYSIDRLIGKFKDSDELNEYLSGVNSNLNDTDNKNNKDKAKGYKQVNIMFVNFGEKTEDYGWALQNHWKNGAKNDFVVTFGTDKSGKVTWSHPFSWTDVEILKSDVREHMIGKSVNDFKSVIDSVSDLVEEKFDRKQFAEFDYIQIDSTSTSKAFIALGTVVACVGYVAICKESY